MLQIEAFAEYMHACIVTLKYSISAQKHSTYAIFKMIYMKIERIVCSEGYGGFFWDDFAAIKKGAIQDGDTFVGEPVHEGFTAIRMPGKAVSVCLIMDDGQVPFGDCLITQAPSESGREPIFETSYLLSVIEEEVVPKLEGREISSTSSFKDLAEEFDSNGKLNMAIKYGVTQALLDAVARAKKMTMAEVIMNEYDTSLASKPISLLCQSGDNWSTSIDRAILKRIPVFPHGLVWTREKLERIPKYIWWMKKRLKELAGRDETYFPTLHLDVYGNIGDKFCNDVSKMVNYFREIEELARPYALLIEQPVDMESKGQQIKKMKELREAIKEEGISVKIINDCWADTLDDIKQFVDAQAMDMIQIKCPDLGGVNNIIEAVLYCKTRKVGAYLGGSCCETDTSAKVSMHIALATEPDLVLAKPGMGVDEAYMICYNEIQRTRAIIASRWS